MKIQILSVNGQLVKNKTSKLYEEKINLDEVKSGNYIVNIFTGEKVVSRWISTM
jgi:hypothetical protein